jgi:hypothetical protein
MRLSDSLQCNLANFACRSDTLAVHHTEEGPHRPQIYYIGCLIAVSKIVNVILIKENAQHPYRIHARSFARSRHHVSEKLATLLALAMRVSAHEMIMIRVADVER